MPDFTGLLSQIPKIWSELLASLPKVIKDRWRKFDPTDFVKKLLEASDPSEIRKILFEQIKETDPETVLKLISMILKVGKKAWPQYAQIIEKLVMVLRVLAESFEKAAS
jgi:hypothetical protein